MKKKEASKVVEDILEAFVSNEKEGGEKKLTREEIERRMTVLQLDFDAKAGFLTKKKQEHSELVAKTETELVQLQGQYDGLRKILEEFFK